MRAWAVKRRVDRAWWSYGAWSHRAPPSLYRYAAGAKWTVRDLGGPQRCFVVRLEIRELPTKRKTPVGPKGKPTRKERP